MVPGVVDLQVEKQVLIPQLRIQVDYERAALYGLTPAAVTQALDALANGRRVSQIVDGNRRFDVMIRLSDQDRSTTGLRDLLTARPSTVTRSCCRDQKCGGVSIDELRNEARV
jgi:HME family heavy-metal exporter